MINLHAEGLKKQYKTRDEKRESAHQYELTDWLSLSAIAEVEQGRRRRKSSVGAKTKADEFSKSLDVEAVIEVSELIRGEVVFEFDDENGGVLVDEAVTIIELGKTELELGKLHIPFGEYYSRFVNGSSLEFAETSAKGVVLSHAPIENIDLSLYVYNGKAKPQDSRGHQIDWGLAAEFSPEDSWLLGIAYISDLADAEEIILDESNNRYSKRVDGFGLYSTIGFSTRKLGDFELTTEYITALRDFVELEEDRNKPSAWNIELAHFPMDKFEWAVRLAGSKELEDEPKRQLGVATTWHINKKVSITLEYLQNSFKKEFVEDDQGRLLDRSKQIGGRLSILF